MMSAPRRAFQIPAAPGWRAVVFHLGEAVNGTAPLTIQIVPIVAWAVSTCGAEQLDPKHCATHFGYRSISLTLGASPFGLGGGVDFIPVGKDGKDIEAFRIVCTDDPDEKLIEEAQAWVAKFNATAKAKDRKEPDRG